MRHSLARIAMCLSVIVSANAASLDICAAQKPPQVTLKKPDGIDIRLKPNASVDRAVICLADVAELNGPSAVVEYLRKILVGIAPIEHQSKILTRHDIQRLLEYHQVPETSVHWSGDERCIITKINETSDRAKPWTATDALPKTTPARTASTTTTTSKTPTATNVSSSEYTPSQANRTLIAQAQRIVETEIQSYIHAATGESAPWSITTHVPDQLISLLASRNAIRGILNTVQPTEGAHLFTFLVDSPEGERRVEIEATLKMPTLVVAAVGPIRKGQLLRDNDLKLVPFRGSGNLKLEECIQDVDAIVGKELKRGLSTGQILAYSDVTTPRVIDRNEQVEIEVITGGVSIVTFGRALESGGLDEVIHVETVHRKRLQARVISDRRVQIISRGVQSP